MNRREPRRISAPERALRVLLAAVLFLAWPSGVGVNSARAQSAVPALVNYQGRLTDALNNPLSGSHAFVFEIYDALTGGNQLWTETRPAVTVVNGVFAVQLGAATALPSAVFSAPDAYLRVTVDGTPLSPRERLITAPYAFNAQLLRGRELGAFVSTDTAQTVAGDKTFTGAVSVPAPTLAGHAATKGYVDAQVGGATGWTDDGAVIRLTTLTDNVVIASTLTVQGNAFSVGTSTFVVAAGRVGVGTANPAAALDVNGVSRFLGNALFSSDVTGDNGANFDLRLRPGSASGAVRVYDAASAAELLRVTNAGSVGVGTPAPATRLDVAGDAQFGAGATKSTFSTTGALTFPSGYAPAAALDAATKGYVDAQVGAGSGWTDDGAVVRLTASADNVVVASTLTVQGNAFSVGGSTLVATIGRVGIGTASPTDPLHVRGNAPSVKLEHTGGADLQLHTSDGSGLAGIRITEGTNKLSIQDAGDTVLARASGSVGIRTVDPAQALDVNGDAQFGFGAAKSTFSATGGLSLAGNAGLTLTGPTAYFTSGSSVTASAFFGDGSNLTGINAADKVAKAGDFMSGQLTTESTITVKGNAFSVGGSTLAVAGGNVGVGAANPARQIHVAGTLPKLLIEDTDGPSTVARLESEVNDNIATFRSLNAGLAEHRAVMTLDLNTGDVGIPSANARLTMSGSGAKTVYAGNWRVGDDSNSFVIQDTQSSQNVLEIQKNGQAGTLFVENTGDVGIGTRAPAALLDVNGTAAFGAGASKSTFSATGRLTFPSGYSPAVPLEAASKGYVDSQLSSAGGWTDDGTVVRLTASGDNVVIASTLTVSGNAFSVGGSTFVVAGGNVGIGTTSPSRALHVVGDEALFAKSGGFQLKFDDTSGGAATQNISFLRAGVLQGTIFNSASNELTLQTTGTPLRFKTSTVDERARIAADGRMGVGVIAPEARLHVSSGNAVAADAVLLVSSGTAVGQELLVVKGDGRIGVGTANPALPFTVEKTGPYGLPALGVNGPNAFLYMLVDEPAFIWKSGHPLRFGTDTSIGTGFSQKMTLDSGGNLGLATASPAALLDVNGAAQFGSGATRSTFSATGVLTFPTGYAPGAALDAATKGYVDSQVSVGSGWTDDGAVVRLTVPGDNVLIASTLTVQGNSFSVGASTFIVKDGSVGIGGANPGPSAALYVNNAVDGRPTLKLENTATSAPYLQFQSGGFIQDLGLARMRLSGRVGVGSGVGAGDSTLWVQGSVADDFHLRVSSQDSTGNLLVVHKAGNVGIGTTNPAQKLHVEGASPQARIAGSSGQDARIDFFPNGVFGGRLQHLVSDNSLRLINDISGGHVVLQPSGAGNVGVGLSAPAQRLHVQGGVRVSTSATSGMALGVNPSDGKVQIGFFQDVVDTPGLDLRYTDSGWGRLDQVLNRWGGDWRWYVGSAGGDRLFARLSGATDVEANSPAFELNNFDGSAVRVRLSAASGASSWINSGNVGVGTTAPASKLHVLDGDIRISTSPAQPSRGIVFQDGTIQTTAAGLSGGGWTDDGVVVRLTAPGDNVVIASTLTVQGNAFSVGGSTLVAAGGKVGVGSAAPSGRLDVFYPAPQGAAERVLRLASSENSDVGFLRLERTAGTLVAWDFRVPSGVGEPHLLVERDGAARLAIGAQGGLGVGTGAGVSDGTLVVRSTSTTAGNPVIAARSNAGGELFRVQEDGRVGVGTGSPKSALDLSGGTLTFGSAASSSTIRQDLSTDDLIIANSRKVPDSDIIFGVQETVEAMRVTGGGNVGVGTAQPGGSAGARLHAVGAGSAGPKYSFLASSGTDAGSYHLMVSTAGKVGVGASDPFYRLHVYSQGEAADVGGVVVERSGAGSTGRVYVDDGNVLNIRRGGGDSRVIALDGSGNVAIGTTSATGQLTLHNEAAGASHLHLRKHSGANAFDRFNLGFYKSRGTAAAPTAVLAGDHVWSVEGSAFDGAAWDYVGGVNMKAAGINGGVVESELHFDTADQPSGTGVTRMTIDKSGNVGVGTTSPFSWLAGTGTLKRSVQVDGWIVARGNGSSSWGDLSGRIGVSSAVAGGENWYFSANSDGKMAVHQGGLGDRLTIDQSGNVGVGMTSPTAKLHVGGTAGVDGIRFPDGTLMTTAGVGSASNLANTVDVVVNADSDANGSGAVRLQTAATDRLTIVNSGAVGVGTTDPSEGGAVNSKLTIRQADAFTGLAVMSAAGGRRFALNPIAGGGWTLHDGAAGGSWTAGVSQSSGNLGVGTSAPEYKLELSGVAASSASVISINRGLFLQDAGGTGHLARNAFQAGGGWNIYDPAKRASTIEMRDFSDASFGNIDMYVTQTAGAIDWKRMLSITTAAVSLADGGGFVGIGKTTPAAHLDIDPADGATTWIRLGGEAATASKYVGLESGGTGFGANSGFSGVEFGAPAGAGEGYLAFHTHDVAVQSGEKMRIDKSGNVGVGTPTPGQKLDVVGTVRGSTLTATQNIVLPDAATNAAGNLFFGGDTSSTRSGLRLFGGLVNGGSTEGGFIDAVSTSATGGLIIRVDSTTGATERMRVTTAGNVGVGISSPTSRLHVHDGDIRVSTSPGQGSRGIVFQDGTVQLTASGASQWAASADDVYATNAGQVGIGIAAPTNSLHVYDRSGAAGRANILIEASAENAYLNMQADAWTANPIATLVKQGSTGLLKFNNAGSSAVDHLVVDGQGRVGAGAVPAARLHVSSANAVSTDQVFLVSSGTAAGQELLTVTGDGKVGIGTTTMNRRLHVHSTNGLGMLLRNDGPGNSVLEIQSMQNAQRAINFLDSSGGAASQIATYGTTAGSSMTFRTSGSEQMKIDENGKVGIGTTNPAAKLHMSSGTLLVDGDASTSLRIGVSSMVVQSDGKVGIGVSSPKHADGATGLDVTGFKPTPYSDEHASRMQIIAADNGAMAQGVGGGIGLMGKVNAAGDYSSFASISAQKANATDGNAAADLVFANRFTDGASFNENMRITAAGNVGVGTTSPSKRLVVSAQGTAASNDAQTRVTDPLNGQTLHLGADGANSVAFIQSDIPGTGARSLLLNAAGGNVGVGTTSPASKLHVLDGDIQVSTSPGQPSKGIVFQDGSVQTTAAGGTGGGWTDAGAVVQLVTPTDSIGSAGAGVTVSTHLIVSAGNVGVGTALPDVKLAVNAGAMRAYYSQGIYPAIYGEFTHAGDAGGLEITARGSTGGGSGKIRFLTAEGTPAERMRIDSAGNVGIGATSPAQKLHMSSGTLLVDGSGGALHVKNGSGQGLARVQGSAAASVFLQDDAGGGVTYQLDSGAEAAGKFTITHSGVGRRLTIDSAGNIGIGTISPQAKLDVRGGIVGYGVSVSTDNVSRSALWLATYGDFNHALYNNFSNIDGEGGWDGAKLNVFNGLNVRIGPSRTSALYLNSSGNFGVGTAAPTARLHVSSESVTAADSVLLVSSGAAAGQELLVVKGDGKLGLGTASPQAPLHLRGGNTALFVTAQSSGTSTAGSGGTARIQLTDYFDSRAVIEVVGAGANGPSDKGTAHGKNLYVKAGDSDNAALKTGGDLYLLPGAPTPPATVYGDVFIAKEGGNVGIGTGGTAPGATLQVNGTMKVLGAWTTQSTGTDYQAASDGYVVARVGVDSGDTCELTGFTDSTSTPTTVVANASAFDPGSSSRVVASSLMMPVRKGDYWRVGLVTNAGNCTGNATVRWIPLGL